MWLFFFLTKLHLYPSFGPVVMCRCVTWIFQQAQYWHAGPSGLFIVHQKKQKKPQFFHKYQAKRFGWNAANTLPIMKYLPGSRSMRCGCDENCRDRVFMLPRQAHCAKRCQSVWSMQNPAGTALDLNRSTVLKDKQNLQSVMPHPVTCSSKKENSVSFWKKTAKLMWKS